MSAALVVRLSYLEKVADVVGDVEPRVGPGVLHSGPERLERAAGVLTSGALLQQLGAVVGLTAVGSLGGLRTLTRHNTEVLRRHVGGVGARTDRDELE